MRHLIDAYIEAKSWQKISPFDVIKKSLLPLLKYDEAEVERIFPIILAEKGA